MKHSQEPALNLPRPLNKELLLGVMRIRVILTKRKGHSPVLGNVVSVSVCFLYYRVWLKALGGRGIFLYFSFPYIGSQYAPVPWESVKSTHAPAFMSFLSRLCSISTRVFLCLFVFYGSSVPLRSFALSRSPTRSVLQKGEVGERVSGAAVEGALGGHSDQ